MAETTAIQIREGCNVLQEWAASNPHDPLIPVVLAQIRALLVALQPRAIPKEGVMAKFKTSRGAIKLYDTFEKAEKVARRNYREGKEEGCEIWLTECSERAAGQMDSIYFRTRLLGYIMRDATGRLWTDLTVLGGLYV